MTDRLRICSMLALGLLLIPAPVAAQRTEGPSQAGVICPKTAAAFARLELLFGTTKSAGGAVTEAEWQAFLDEEVTKRFPDGLTVLTGYGQFRASSGNIVKEAAKMLIIWYKPDGDSEARIEAVRQAYKSRFAQESVLRADGASCISF